MASQGYSSLNQGVGQPKEETMKSTSPDNSPTRWALGRRCFLRTALGACVITPITSLPMQFGTGGASLTKEQRDRMTPSQVIEELKKGNERFRAGKMVAHDYLRTGMLRPVYHGEHGLRTLRELGRSYQTISKDLNRVMNRLKALQLLKYPRYTQNPPDRGFERNGLPLTTVTDLLRWICFHFWRSWTSHEETSVILDSCPGKTEGRLLNCHPT
jgi:hypothetical protein